MAAHERETVLSGALSSARYLVALQAGSRLVTFALNQALLRLATPAAYGTVAIQLEFLLNTILFFAREGIRGAVLRTAGGEASGQRHDRIVRTTFVPLLAGIPLALAGCLLYISTADPVVARQAYFRPAVAVYGVAALVELASEPAFLLSQIVLDSKTRVRAEGAAVICRAIATAALLYIGGERLALPSFAAGQAVYGTVLLAALYSSYGSRAWQAASRATQIDAEARKLAIALTKQSLVKQVLQEGDKFAVSRLSTVTDQGAYAVALNYGSLVVRIVFQPIEEAARLYFARSAGTAGQLDKQSRSQMAAALAALVHLHIVLALAAVSFAPPFVPLLCRLLLGSRWSGSSAPTLLRSYVYLLPFLGLNGVLEAFVHSTATQAELSASSRALVVASALFAGSCLAFRGLDGPRATMLGTALGMGYRIWWSARLAATKLKGQQLDYLPAVSSLVAFLASGLATRFWEPAVDAPLRSHAVHVGVGGLALLVVMAVSYRSELETFRRFRRAMAVTAKTKK